MNTLLQSSQDGREHPGAQGENVLRQADNIRIGGSFQRLHFIFLFGIAKPYNNNFRVTVSVKLRVNKFISHINIVILTHSVFFQKKSILASVSSDVFVFIVRTMHEEVENKFSM